MPRATFEIKSIRLKLGLVFDGKPVSKAQEDAQYEYSSLVAYANAQSSLHIQNAQHFVLVPSLRRDTIQTEKNGLESKQNQ